MFPLTPVATSLEKVLRTYMDSLSTDSVQSVSELCRNAPMSRTTFYKHFESLEDLDERFLHLHFWSYLGSTAQPLTSYEDLARFYRSLVRSMRDQHRFFCRVIVLKEHARYFVRWQNLVDDRVRALFGRAALLSSPALWELHIELALGVIHRYMEMGLSSREEDVDELTHWMMEYLWGGLMRFRDLFEGVAVPMNNEVAQKLEWRATQDPGRPASRPPLVRPP